MLAPRSTEDPATTTEPTATDAQGWARFGLLAVIWGSSFLFIRVGLDEGIAPLMMVSLRVLVAGLLLGSLMIWRGGRLPTSRAAWGRITVLALTNVVLPYVLMAWGLQYILTGLGAIINASVPLFTILLAGLVLHDEPVTVGRLSGLLVGFLGVIVLALPSLTRSTGDTAAWLAIGGMLAIALASLLYAIAAVYTRHRITGKPLVTSSDGRARPLSSLEISFTGFLVSFALLLPLTLVFERPTDGLVALPQSAAGWFAMIWLGALGTGIAYVLFFGLIERWGATRTTLVTYVIPVIAILIGFVLLGERLEPLELVGAMLVLSGVAVVNSPLGRRRLFGRAAAPSGP